MSDQTIREQTYSYFLAEAQDLLLSLDQDLRSLRQERSAAKVHSLMRAAHTLKGAAASVGFESVKTIAHTLEDVFKALYRPEVVIDGELEALLLEGYDCLRSPLTAAIAGTECDEALLLRRSEQVFERLRTKLGKHFDPTAAIPTSSELGFDITLSLFETGVRDRLEQLTIVMESGSPEQILETLQTQAEVFAGLAESLALPGFGAIAKATLRALNANPDRVLEIAQVALADWRQGQMAVLDGDRSRGGAVSDALKRLTQRGRAGDTGTSGGSIDRVRRAWSRLVEFLNPPKLETAATVPMGGTAGRLKEAIDRPASLSSASEIADEATLDELEATLQAWSDSLTGTALDEVALKEAVDGLAVDGFEDWDETVEPALVEPVGVHSATVEPKAVPVANSGVGSAMSVLSDVTVRVNLDHLESLNYTTSELLIDQNRQVLQDEHLQGVVRELVDGLKRHEQTMLRLREWAEQLLVSPERFQQNAIATSDELKEAFDALELDRHHEVHELLQSALEELVPLGMGAEAIEGLVRQGSGVRDRQGRLLNHVRDDLMVARMMPIGSLLNRFPQIVAQLAEQYGKRVELRISGTQVLVDKAISEKLYDPLLHLVRNAFDHGIEDVQIRRQLGKPEVGRIEIRASQQGNRTLIEVSDDGRGLDFARICQRGFELKRLPSNQVEQVDRAALLELLFEPGFSTTQQVSELSGRGVGLDVVRSQMNALQGKLTVRSEAGQGTAFTLRLPLTLMSARLLICQIGQRVYGLLSDEVERILMPGAERVESLGDRRILHWQYEGQEWSIPVHRMRSELFELIAVEQPESEMHGLVSPILVMRRQGEWMALECDRILGEQELVIRPLGHTIAPPPYVYGCSVLGDGQLILVVDGAGLVQYSSQALNAAVSVQKRAVVSERRSSDSDVPEGAERSQKQTVLVVDDSITVRQALLLTFQQAGYTVLQAQDGLEAILQLKKHPEIQMVTCDVEMPRMNGFEFLVRYGQEMELPQVPVIMLTSRSNEKHQRLAMQLGAADYLTKPFLEAVLLERVDQVMQGVVA